MKSQLAQLGQWLAGYGAFGLIILSFIDSGLLPLPEAIDFLVMSMSAKAHHKLPEYVLAAAIGSLIGCMFLYFIAARGGHAFLERRVGKDKAERMRVRLEKYEFVTIMVTTMLPPPTPFKAIILTAGVIEVNPWKFGMAVFVGRLIRYAVEGYLAIEYGDRVWEWLKHHGIQVGLWGMAVIAMVALVMWMRSRYAPINEPRP